MSPLFLKTHVAENRMYSVWLPGACSSPCWSHVRLSRVLCLRPLFWGMASSLVAVGILSSPTTRVLFILSLIFFLPGSAPGVHPVPSLSSRPLAGRGTRVGRPLGGAAGLSASEIPLFSLRPPGSSGEQLLLLRGVFLCVHYSIISG